MNGRVLITGAAGALGRSVVRQVAGAGERVLAVGDREGLADLAAAAPPGAVEIRKADLTVTAEVDALFAEAPSAVIHTVGGFRFGRLAEMTDDDWSFLLKVNLETTFRVCRAAARAFASAQGGSLVAVAAPAGLLGEAGLGAYSATKAGVLRLVESLARELAPVGARANAVLPGTMDTAANRAAMPGADPRQWVSTEAVAAVIHFLTTPAAAAVNGAAVRVPGPIL
jgi:NAD(P)-dependent dehydrogenase (short-subunit alcohol dehydrogenase family)